MKHLLLLVFTLILTYSCSNKTESNGNSVNEIEDNYSQEIWRKDILDNYEYVDSTKLWSPEMNLILAIKSEPYDNRLYIHVYNESDEGLRLVQSFDSLDTEFGQTTPIFEDFNNDNLVDFKIEYGSGARGSNIFYHIFLQEISVNGYLTRIKNSESKPNLTYDASRHTITSTAFWAGTSYTDYEIVSDSIVPTRGVDVYFKPTKWTIREYYEFGKNHQRQVVRLDSVADNGEGLYTRENK